MQQQAERNLAQNRGVNYQGPSAETGGWTRISGSRKPGQGGGATQQARVMSTHSARRGGGMTPVPHTPPAAKAVAAAKPAGGAVPVKNPAGNTVAQAPDTPLGSPGPAMNNRGVRPPNPVAAQFAQQHNLPNQFDVRQGT